MYRSLRATGLGLVLCSLSAGVPAAQAQAPAPDATTGGDVRFRLSDATPTAGRDVRARGEATAGAEVRLLHRADGATAWTALGTDRADADGDFLVRVAVPSAGRLRVVDAGAPERPATEGRVVRPEAGLSVSDRRTAVKRGSWARVRGTARPASAGSVVRLQERRGSRWRTVDRDRTDASGRFSLRDRVSHTGRRTVRVQGGSTDGVASGTRTVGSVVGLRSALASWYGPGLYGGRLACGGTLTAGTLGVAHKSLPCGTRITLRHGGRTVRTEVVDRGPYVGAREFDLTAATKQRLGFGSTGTVLVDR